MNIDIVSIQNVNSTDTSELDSHVSTICAGANCKTTVFMPGVTVRIILFR